MDIYILGCQFGDEYRVVGVFSQKEYALDMFPSVLADEGVTDPKEVDRLVKELAAGEARVEDYTYYSIKTRKMDTAYNVFGMEIQWRSEGEVV